MAIQLEDLVWETSTSTGTGNLTTVRNGGYQRGSEAFGTGDDGDANPYIYIVNRNAAAAEWEICRGYWSAAGTLVRDSVVRSSNANAAVNFGAGTKDITNDIPARLQFAGSMVVGPDVLSPEQFGAVGDYDPSTGTGTDDYTAIQAMFDAVGDVSTTQRHYPTVFWFRPGARYKVGTTPKIQQYNCLVKGNGAAIRMTGTGPALMVDHANSVNSVIGVSIDDIWLQAATGNTANHAFHARSAPMLSLSRIIVKDLNTAADSGVSCGGRGILIEGCVSYDVQECEIYNANLRGIEVQSYNKNYSGQPTPTGNTHSNTTIDGISSMTGIAVGMRVTGSGIPANTDVATVNVPGNSITITNAATATANGVTLTFSVVAESQSGLIHDCVVWHGNSIGIIISEGGGHAIRNCDIEDNASGGVEIRSCYDFTIDNNYFEVNTVDITVRNLTNLVPARVIQGGRIINNQCESTTAVSIVNGDEIRVICNRFSSNWSIGTGVTDTIHGLNIQLAGGLTNNGTNTKSITVA